MDEYVGEKEHSPRSIVVQLEQGYGEEFHVFGHCEDFCVHAKPDWH